jgi:hypothetical protein
MIYGGARMQSRLSTIDVSAEALPQPAREHWHNATFDEIQRARKGTLVERHAM